MTSLLRLQSSRCVAKKVQPAGEKLGLFVAFPSTKTWSPCAVHLLARPSSSTFLPFLWVLEVGLICFCRPRGDVLLKMYENSNVRYFAGYSIHNTRASAPAKYTYMCRSRQIFSRMIVRSHNENFSSIFRIYESLSLCAPGRFASTLPNQELSACDSTQRSNMILVCHEFPTVGCIRPPRRATRSPLEPSQIRGDIHP